MTSRHEPLEAHSAREEAGAQSRHVFYRARLAPLERRYEARDELGAQPRLRRTDGLARRALVARVRAQHNCLLVVHAQLYHAQQQREGLLPYEVAQVGWHEGRRQQVQRRAPGDAGGCATVHHGGRPADVRFVAHVLVQREKLFGAPVGRHVAKVELRAIAALE